MKEMSGSTQNLPQLREISLLQVSKIETLPKPRIKTDHDLDVWRGTSSYRDYSLFLRRLNEAVVGHYLPWNETNPSQSILRTITLLDEIDTWIDEIPPQASPQRFGNLAFRTWGSRLEERADDLLRTLFSPDFSVVIPLVKPYLLTSFGSFTRMDYGTGHETSFALFLLSLTLVRFFHPDEKEERELVLCVFVRYLRLCWKLQDTYRLEPAGSHGVWGLDDSSFLGYIFGSAQLREQTEIPVSAVLQPSLPATNLYFLSINRIRQVKIGPFHEHSSQLHSIAVGVPNWKKVNSGLFKMYEAEVLGKRVVVQHIPLGGLLEWDKDKDFTPSLPLQASMMAAPPATSSASTQAPWAYKPTQVPWASAAPWGGGSAQGLRSTSGRASVSGHGILAPSPLPSTSSPLPHSHSPVQGGGPGLAHDLRDSSIDSTPLPENPQRE